MHNFKELKIWRLGMDLTRMSYKMSRGFPPEEKFGITSQIRRSAVSVPSNIAEGCGRGTDKQLVHFLDISLGSACELETQMILALELEHTNQKNFDVFNLLLGEFQRRTRTFRDKLANQIS